MGVEIWSVNYLIDVVEIFGSPSIFKIDILGDLHAKFHDFCSNCTIVSQYYYTIIEFMILAITLFVFDIQKHHSYLITKQEESRRHCARG